MADPSRWSYRCAHCHQGLCICGTTPQRIAAREARVYAVLAFPCIVAGCRRVCDTVMARLVHMEQEHAHEE
jgi:hypothetical protein